MWFRDVDFAPSSTFGWARDWAEVAVLKAAVGRVGDQSGSAAEQLVTDRSPKLVVPGCDDEVMSLSASPAAAVSRVGRVEVLFAELAELAGQRNAIDARIVEIVAELDRDALCGATGARSMPALVAWKLGCSSANAHTITAPRFHQDPS